MTIDNDSLETIIDKSSGDFRKIINTLQTCSMISNNIDEDTIDKSLGFPKKNEIDIIYRTLMNDELSKSYRIINKIKNSQGYSLIDIIKSVFNRLLIDIDENIITHKKYASILNKLGIIEYNLLNSTNDNIQLTSFISLFKSI